MENKDNSKLLLKALEDFKSTYPMSTSADLQTFIIGWNQAVKVLSLDNPVHITNNDSLALDEKEKLFLELISQLTLKNDNVWYNSDGEWVILENVENKYIWFSYDRFWSKFESKFDFNIEIRDFLRGMVSKHLNLNGYIPNRCVD